MVEQNPNDQDFWDLLTQYCKDFPNEPECLKTATNPDAPAASGSAAAPVNGQVLSVTVKGMALASTMPGVVAPDATVRFQTLRPQPGGSVSVIVTSQAFMLPTSGDPDQMTTFTPTNMCVQAGDYIGISTEGGGAVAGYSNGTPFQVFAPVSGSSVNQFASFNGLMNGSSFTGVTIPNVELLMQATVGTGNQGTALCLGGTAN